MNVQAPVEHEAQGAWGGAAVAAREQCLVRRFFLNRPALPVDVIIVADNTYSMERELRGLASRFASEQGSSNAWSAERDVLIKKTAQEMTRVCFARGHAKAHRGVVRR